MLASNDEALDAIALSADLTLFTAFADNRPVPGDFDGRPDDLPESTEWFDPEKGRVAMQALADHIQGSHRAADLLDGAPGVVEELEEMARVLGWAAAQGVRFRLELS